MTDEDKICPLIKEPCIGKKCGEFVPRHTYRAEYGYGIQDLIINLWCLVTKNKLPDNTYTETIYAHCAQGMSSADRWDKDEFKEDWTGVNKK